MTRIAIISDTHMPRGARRLPDACVERIQAADLLLHAGDVADLATLDMLRRLGPPLHAVAGNVDDAVVRARLPVEAVLTAGGVRIGMVHDSGAATGRLARLRVRFPDADAVVFGHSHLPLHEQGDGLQIFNPGSPTERRRAPHHTMGVAVVEGGRIAFELIALD
jgi:putative phosphoesterase